MTATEAIRIVPARERFHTKIDWLDSWHSFSFGPHYDPSNVRHGLLLVSNDDVVAPGSGFGMHPHRDMEIVTWVLRGELEHRDSAGNHGVIYPGLAQRMSAGTGIHHSEVNRSSTEDVRLIQMWVLPDHTGVEPSYEQADVSEALGSGELVAIASGQGHDTGVRIHQRDAVLWGARIQPGAGVTVPDGGHVHVFAAVGGGELEGAGQLAEGDAARLRAAGERRFTAGDEGAEVLVWVTA